MYKRQLGGQPNCPITVRDGYLYTGFWGGETKKANYVCLSITDEDPTQETEEKLATWTYAQKGGFYWAGALSLIHIFSGAQLLLQTVPAGAYSHLIYVSGELPADPDLQTLGHLTALVCGADYTETNYPDQLSELTI